MKLLSPKVWFMKHSVMLFSLGYVLLSLVTTVQIVTLKQSYVIAFLAAYCYGQVCLNWKAMFFFSSKDKGTDEEDSNPYSYCPDCKIVKHRLSHHCPLCQHCVLRHDHHCFFLGTCIGLRNQGYFVIFCLYSGLGSLYLAVEILLASDWTFENWYNYLELFMPFGFVFSLLRAKSPSSAYMVVVYNLSTVTGIFCVTMFLLQVHLLSRSLTWHEFNTNSRPAKGCTWRNFKANFSRFGLIRFIVPVIPAHLKQYSQDSYLNEELVL